MLLLLVGLPGNHVGIVVSDGAGGIHENTGYFYWYFFFMSVMLLLLFINSVVMFLSLALQSKGMEADSFYCMELLNASGVCVVPGCGFNQAPDTYHFR